MARVCVQENSGRLYLGGRPMDVNQVLGGMEQAAWDQQTNRHQAVYQPTLLEKRPHIMDLTYVSETRWDRSCPLFSSLDLTCTA